MSYDCENIMVSLTAENTSHKREKLASLIRWRHSLTSEMLMDLALAAPKQGPDA